MISRTLVGGRHSDPPTEVKNDTLPCYLFFHVKYHIVLDTNDAMCCWVASGPAACCR